jgi:sporulation protein YlmC with PRC-barrel domain
MDKGILDRDGLRCGKVDDLRLELPSGGGPPRVAAIVTGPLAFTRTVSPRLALIVRVVYRAAGVRDPHPVEIDWDQVARIDAAVHLTGSSGDGRLQELPRALAARFKDIPGA